MATLCFSLCFRERTRFQQRLQVSDQERNFSERNALVWPETKLFTYKNKQLIITLIKIIRKLPLAGSSIPISEVGVQERTSAVVKPQSGTKTWALVCSQDMGGKQVRR